MCGMISFVGASALGAEYRFDGIYTGKRSLIKGSGQVCPVKEDVSVTINGETLSFTNSVLKKFVIGFYPREDGSFSQTYDDEGGDEVRIQGRITGDVIEADVINPPCEHHWRLMKVTKGR
jgi:hypothetical protein